MGNEVLKIEGGLSKGEVKDRWQAVQRLSSQQPSRSPKPLL